MILALESVFEQCSVALVALDGTVIAEETLLGNRQQTQQILPMIQALLRQQTLTMADLSAIAFNRGPGAFSGIRINTAVAQALAFAHDLPCLPVSSLQAVAQHAYVNTGLNHVYAAIDARMNQVYLGEFAVKDTIMQAISDDTETLLDYQHPTEKNLPLVGNGATLLQLQPDQPHNSDIVPTGATIGQLGAYALAHGGGVRAENALPVYLRHNAWKTLAEQKG